MTRETSHRSPRAGSRSAPLRAPCDPALDIRAIPRASAPRPARSPAACAPNNRPRLHDLAPPPRRAYGRPGGALARAPKRPCPTSTLPEHQWPFHAPEYASKRHSKIAGMLPEKPPACRGSRIVPFRLTASVSSSGSIDQNHTPCRPSSVVAAKRSRHPFGATTACDSLPTSAPVPHVQISRLKAPAILPLYVAAQSELASTRPAENPPNWFAQIRGHHWQPASCSDWSLRKSPAASQPGSTPLH